MAVGGAALASALLVVLGATTIRDAYVPTDQQLKAVFPEEYHRVREEVADDRCAASECTLEEIYKIFELDSAPVMAADDGRRNGSDDRVALTGDGCPSGKIRVKDSCIDAD